MQYVYYCLVFLSTVSVAVLFEVKKVYVIERDFKTGQLRARRQNIPVPSHTMARIGGLDHQLHHHHHHQPPPPPPQQLFSVAVSPPPIQQSLTAAAAGGQQQQPQQQAQDLASTVDLTTAADSRAPIDYLTPPPSTAFQMQNFQVPSGAADQMVRAESHHTQQNVAAVHHTAPALGPFAAPAHVAVQTSPFTPVVGFQSGLQAQPPPLTSMGPQSVQLSSPSNQVNSLTFASPPLEHFTPYTPTLVQNEPPPAAAAAAAAVSHQHQHQLHHPQAQQQSGGRWELGFDASDILTPPFASSSPADQPGQLLFQQDFGQEAVASSTVRNNKQYVGGGLFFGGGGGSYDTPGTTNTKFTPQDAVVRTSPSNAKNVYWGTPKSAQQLPLRPPPSYVEPNAYRFNNHHLHHPQYVDTFQMPFTGQFDGPLSQGTVADHVVHSSFRIKRELGKYIYDEAPQVRGEEEEEAVRSGQDEASDDVRDAVGDRKPVYSYVKTDRNGNFKWSVRHGY